MKLLMLGASHESGSHPIGNIRIEHIAKYLAEDLGQPVEIEPRQLWPNHRMPAHVERIISDTTPDLIYLLAHEYAIAYPSTPVRLRRFGPVGRWLANRSLLFADNEVLSYNRPTRALRWLLQVIVGGEPHVPVEQGIAAYLEAIRIAARQEDALLLVVGPHGTNQWGSTGRQKRSAEATRSRLNAALRDTCAALHIPYTGFDTPVHKLPDHRYHMSRSEFGGDGTHFTAESAKESARRHADDIAFAYREHAAAHG